MVAVSSPSKVLVTSANGYLATWVVKKYLEAGYSVRGTVRSLSKSAFLKEKFAHYGDRFELVVVEDITKDGAFDEAVKDVDAIAHTASPFHYKSSNPDVRGTTSILNSALEHGNILKRLILTSSVATIREDTTVPRVSTKGSAAGPVRTHQSSKTLAEKVAWKFVATHGSNISWDLVVINPPCIFGPSLCPTPSVDDLNTSQREIYDALSGARTNAQLRGQGNWVHVAVAAEAHVRATYAVSASGQRITVKSGSFFNEDLLDLAAELGVPNVPRGEPGSTKNTSVNVETRKAEEPFGLTRVRPLKHMVATGGGF